MSANSVVKVDSDIPFEKVAIFGCAVITGIGAQLAGASKIIALDINPNKFDMAKKLGATYTFDSSDEKFVDELKELTNGGVNYAFETAGVVPAMEVAYKITRRGGMTVTTGLPDPKHNFSFPQVTLTAEERTVKGSYVGSCVPTRDIPRFIELYKQGRLPVDTLLSDTLKLEDINEGFDRLEKGDMATLVFLEL